MKPPETTLLSFWLTINENGFSESYISSYIVTIKPLLSEIFRQLKHYHFKNLKKPTQTIILTLLLAIIILPSFYMASTVSRNKNNLKRFSFSQLLSHNNSKYLPTSYSDSMQQNLWPKYLVPSCNLTSITKTDQYIQFLRRREIRSEAKKQMVNLNRGVVAHSQNPSAADGHGIGERERLVTGVYLGIFHHQVRHWRPPT